MVAGIDYGIIGHRPSEDVGAFVLSGAAVRLGAPLCQALRMKARGEYGHDCISPNEAEHCRLKGYGQVPW